MTRTSDLAAAKACLTGLCGAEAPVLAAVSGGLVKPEPWLLEGLFSKETGAVQLLLPVLKPWMNVGRLALLYGAGLLAAFWPRNVIRTMDTFRPTLWRGAVLTVLTLWSVLSFTGITTFIYSNF